MYGTCVLAKPHSRVDPREGRHAYPSQHAITNGTLGARKRGTFDPHIGRFLNTDPIIADIFNGQTLNAFSYVGNNPFTLIDPSGFEPDKPPILPIAEQVTTGADGSITVDLLYPPYEGQAQKALPNWDGATSSVGTAAPTHDVNTTGDLAGELIQELKDAEELDRVEESVYRIQ